MHTSGVTILTTDLARTDRRALSEAWYGAMHVAERSPRLRTSAAGSTASVARGSAKHTDAAAHGPKYASSSTTIANRGTRADTLPRAGAQLDRRSGLSPLSRRIERAVAKRATRKAISALTISDRNGRVLVMVRNDGTRTRVIAVCPSLLREQVERALAHARFALAATPARIEAA